MRSPNPARRAAHAMNGSHWIAWITTPCGNFATPAAPKISGGRPAATCMSPCAPAQMPSRHDTTSKTSPPRAARSMSAATGGRVRHQRTVRSMITAVTNRIRPPITS